MGTPIAVWTADTHLAQRAWVRHPTLEGDAYYGLQQVVDYCTTRGLPLFLAGDVFDKTRPDPKTVQVMRVQIERMMSESQNVYFIQGQHELDRASPWILSISDWPLHIHNKTFELGQITFRGLDWTPADAVQDEFSKISANTNVLIAHQVWRDFMRHTNMDAECSFGDVPHVRMIFTGDFHRHTQLAFTNASGRGATAYSAGPLAMQSIDEDPSKFFYVLYDDLSVHAVPVKTRNVYRFDIANKEELEIFLEGNIEHAVAPQTGVPNNIAKNIVHVTYKDSIPEAYGRIVNAIKDRAHLFLVPVKQKADVVQVDAERRRNLSEGGLSACLELVVPKGSALHRDVLTLLRAQDPAAQLELMQQQFLLTYGAGDD